MPLRGLKRAQAIGLFYLARLTPGILNLCLILSLSARLPPESYGLFSSWLAFSMGGAFLAFGWVSQSVARHANAEDDYLQESPESFVVGVIASAAAAALVLAPISLFVLPGTGFSLALLAGLSIILHGIHAVMSAALQARLRFTKYILVETSRPLFALAFCLIALFVLGSSKSPVGFYVAGQAVGITAACFIIRKALPRCVAAIRRTSEWKALLPRLKVLFAYGAPISVWLGLTAGWPAIERRIMVVLTSSEEVGRYAAEYDISFRAFVFVLLPITLYVQPFIFRDYSNGNLVKANALIRRAIIGQVALGSIFTFGFLAIVFNLLPALGYTTSMRASSVGVLCAAATAWQTALTCHKWLECQKKVYTMLLVLSAALIVGLGISIACFALLQVGAVSFAIGFLFAGISYCIGSYLIGLKLLRGVSA
ncbi:hypothetical protein [Pseudoxanthomonas sp. J31]|jgi:hypothetical protein|uniref:hypothetical protein n=1 Tax=Pseudoxanthomonas sp. J31 TaxID=935851 RepID=UPI0012EB4936|nr:hypothetical protein [Pseudoxanthomonas sp. J31]